MLRSDFFLQLIFILLTAGLLSLFAVRMFPSQLFAEHAASEPVKIISPNQPRLNRGQPAPTPVIPPDAINIPSLQLHLPVAQGMIVDDQWTLYDDKISWLVTSQTPGRGNVILYGHNRLHLFAGLKYLPVGASIQVSQNGKEYKYIVSEKKKISPGDVDALLSDRDQLTLYTCDGTFDQRRLLVIALPKR